MDPAMWAQLLKWAGKLLVLACTLVCLSLLVMVGRWM